MTSSPKKVLLIGFGNPGRLDDGLGPALAEAIENLNLLGVTVDSDYQLTVEDASQISEHNVVIFADASTNCDEPYIFREIKPKTDISFSSHSISPENVLGLSEELFAAKTQGFVLEIRGYDFNEFGQKLSSKAQDNLIDAVEFVKAKLVELTKENDKS
ncbi:MAG: hydrogenase maturation protease [Candidatus Zapsychrus exili]|nr:hydrogenase maturation protease [Candidatus Zapsychrus exili]